jgi:hypothetical protein
MSEYVPLDRLVLNLLALAEAAPHLPSEALESLANLAEGLEPTVDGLAAVGLGIQTELLGYPAFDQAKAAWNTLQPERYGLELDVINEDLANPDVQLTTGRQPLDPLVGLETITREALQDPKKFSEQTSLLERLARWLGLRWPRR